MVLALMAGTGPVMADDVGITKARLIQVAETRYVLEADVPQALVWSIKAPIFPDRFQVSELEYSSQTGWIVVQATATTTENPLSSQDEILLPWLRNGAALTAQWLDGTIRQGLFLRSLEGIHVPLQLLMTTPQSRADMFAEHFRAGLSHAPFRGVHIIFVVVLFLLFPSRKVFKALAYYTFGQALSLVLADAGMPGPDLLLADITGLVIIFLAAGAAARQSSGRPYLPLIALFGLVHGLA